MLDRVVSVRAVRADACVRLRRFLRIMARRTFNKILRAKSGKVAFHYLINDVPRQFENIDVEMEFNYILAYMKKKVVDNDVCWNHPEFSQRILPYFMF